MKRFALSFVGALLSIGAATAASAHHSAAQFHFQNTVTLTGIVKEATFSNPHARILLEVTDDERGTRDIEFEGHSRNNMYRQGFRPDMMKVGDKITIRIWPMRDGRVHHRVDHGRRPGHRQHHTRRLISLKDSTGRVVVSPRLRPASR